jgi:hypothetical protein
VPPGISEAANASSKVEKDHFKFRKTTNTIKQYAKNKTPCVIPTGYIIVSKCQMYFKGMAMANSNTVLIPSNKAKMRNVLIIGMRMYKNSYYNEIIYAVNAKLQIEK